MFPLTSPSRATVDKRLLGFWKTETIETHRRIGVLVINECAKLHESFLDRHPNLPRGAMRLRSVSLNETPSPNGNSSLRLIWPTTIGSTTYLNHGEYNMVDKKLKAGSDAWFIGKYVVTGDSVTVYYLTGDAKKRISSRLGKDYSSSDLLQEITKAAEWNPSLKLSRIRF